MLCKVGEYAAVLQMPAVRQAIGGSGYSKKYQTAKLYEALKGSQRDRVTALVRHLDRGDITRDTIAAITKREEQAEANNGVLAQPTGNGSDYSLVVWVPGENDWKLIGASYPCVDTLRRALGVYDNLTKAAATVVFAPLRCLSVIIDKLFPACGFNSAQFVFLLRRPDTPNLIDAEVAVISERGNGGLINPAKVDWLPQADEIDRVAFVERLSSTTKRKLLMFSSEHRAGWDTRSWAEKPSL